MNKILTIGILGLLCLDSGCQLREVRSKSKIGPEFRHSGSNSTENVRWTVQQGIEFKWDHGLSTGFTYRRRDVDDGNGDHDDGVWFDFSFPLWKAKKVPAAEERRLEVLEARLDLLESKLNQETVQR